MQLQRNLYIGGTRKKAGWEIFNIASGDNIDHVGNALNMICFSDIIFQSIHSSTHIEKF